MYSTLALGALTLVIVAIMSVGVVNPVIAGVSLTLALGATVVNALLASPKAA